MGAYYIAYDLGSSPSLSHYQVKGAKHGVRRWQNYDGSLTPAGRIHYGVGPARAARAETPKSANRGAKSQEGLFTRKTPQERKQAKIAKLTAKIETNKAIQKKYSQTSADYSHEAESAEAAADGYSARSRQYRDAADGLEYDNSRYEKRISKLDQELKNLSEEAEKNPEAFQKKGIFSKKSSAERKRNRISDLKNRIEDNKETIEEYRKSEADFALKAEEEKARSDGLTRRSDDYWKAIGKLERENKRSEKRIARLERDIEKLNLQDVKMKDVSPSTAEFDDTLASIRSITLDRKETTLKDYFRGR